MSHNENETPNMSKRKHHNNFRPTPDYDDLTAHHGDPLTNRMQSTLDTPEFAYRITTEFAALTGKDDAA